MQVDLERLEVGAVGGDGPPLVGGLHQLLAEPRVPGQQRAQARGHLALTLGHPRPKHSGKNTTMRRDQGGGAGRLEGELLHEQVHVLVNLEPVQVVRVTLQHDGGGGG